jgi:thioredoxin reductase (NADPH)
LKMNWAVLRENIGKHVRSLNQGYITGLKEAKVQYANAYATFKDKYTVELTNPTAPTKTATARRFIVATGGRPRYPDIPGAKEHCITSDEIFALDKSPGHTLIVGASYIALETGACVCVAVCVVCVSCMPVSCQPASCAASGWR